MRANAAIAAAIFAVALAVRLIFLAFSGDAHWPHSIYYEGDAPTWAAWAACLNHGLEFERGLPLRSPAVAYVLHWLSPVLGERNYLGFKTLWCVLSATTCALLYLAAVPLGRRVALIAATLLTFSFGSYITATSLNNECLYALAIVLIAWATAKLVAKPTVWLSVACGLLHGLAVLVRPEHTLLVLLLTAYVGIRAVGPPRKRVGSVATVLAMFLAVCLPWSLHASRAVQRFNSNDTTTLDAAIAQPPWTPEAIAYLNTLPPFLRADNFQYLTFLARQAGEREVTLDRVHRFFEQEIGAAPENLSSWVFVSPMGPLNFALANHSQAGGGFSKAALDARFGPDPPLTLSLPSHVELVNHGYTVGLEYIRNDPAAWLRNVGSKLLNFSDGVTIGIGAYNWPLGREGVRRAVDVLSPPPGVGWVWKSPVLAAVIVGVYIATARPRSPIALICVLIVVYKVIVTILFFGYARQALSIQPATAVLVGVALDAGLVALDRWPRLKPVGWIGILVATGAVIATDIRAASRPAALRVIGPARLAPHWAENAFEASGTIELRSAPQ